MIPNKVKKVLNISWATKMLKNRPLMIFRPEMRAYRRNFMKLNVCLS